MSIHDGSFFEVSADEDVPSLGEFAEDFMKGQVRPNLAKSTMCCCYLVIFAASGVFIFRHGPDPNLKRSDA